MNKTLNFKKTISFLLSSALAVSCFPKQANAAEADPLVVVSLGDSYSSGEGIPAFYGQEKAVAEKVKDEDWLAHRSTKSWPSLLEFSEISGSLKNYNVKKSDSAECKWYFAASSGAETRHFSKEEQKKTVQQKKVNSGKKYSTYLPKQLDVFDQVEEETDYVTLSVGGNDVGFEEIITQCATGSTYLHSGSGKTKIEKMMDEVWDNFDETEANIRQVYEDVQEKAGEQAEIIVAGYPKLLDKEGKGFLISKKEATVVNTNVTKFNNKIESIVRSCSEEGMNIHFVSVEAEFDKDGGHQAYSDNAWINKIILTKQSEDLEYKGLASAYSIHPNEEGAKAYARCVNAAIKDIEAEKQAAAEAAVMLSVEEMPAELMNNPAEIMMTGINEELLISETISEEISEELAELISASVTESVEFAETESTEAPEFINEYQIKENDKEEEILPEPEVTE